MLKAVWALVLVLLLSVALTARAQDADTLKRDSVKIDTNLLNKYRKSPRKNIIPVRTPPLSIQEEYVPVTMLDYKISYWRRYVTFALNINQAAFSNNFAAGGVSNLALGTNFIYRLQYNKAPFSYTSELNLLYGKSKNKGQSARKTNDRIFYDNKVATQMSKHWFFFGSLTFESQFDTGYQYDPNNVNPPVLVSNFMAPGYLTESIGFEFKPTSYFDLRFGTGTARQTFVLDEKVFDSLPADAPADEELYGVRRGRSIRTDIAFQMVAIFDKDIAKNMHLNARYDMFVPYGEPLNFTRHRFDALLAAKVNRLINVSINATILYDEKSKPGVQATEGLSLGILYKFP